MSASRREVVTLDCTGTIMRIKGSLPRCAVAIQTAHCTIRSIVGRPSQAAVCVDIWNSHPDSSCYTIAVPSSLDTSGIRNYPPDYKTGIRAVPLKHRTHSPDMR